ncbi:UNVERIFIED_ORG: KilA domain-containing protein [Zoogloea ramigera]|uniref:KilA-N domain-containing protein n=1 Tax=Duganella zoogloeoides TaxID=75659 RepID=A0ABZ0Y618_9BURK|nr:KilA-N domain-containing protein [Duganella zoogloeoides]WQH06851.1 KilA-N domain-containing protein [Duganella zoogloeoides]
MNHLKIADIPIRTDEAGRFSLNDLHKAAGGEARHKPHDFLRSQQTQALVSELAGEESDTGIPASVVSIKGGLNQGTYAGKELVYAYAMWISAKFHLQVIRTFDAVANGALPAPAAKAVRAAPVKSPVMVAAGMMPALVRALRCCGIDKNAAAIGANQIATAQTGVNLLALAGQQHLPTPDQEICFTPTELGHRRCISAKTFNRTLADAGLQERVGEHWVPTAKGRPHAVVLDTGKAHGNGTPIQQVKWKDSVLAEVAL